MQKKPAHRIAFVGVDILGDGDEADAKRHKLLDAADGINHRAAPSIQFPDQHGIKPPFACVIHEPVEGRAAYIPAGNPLINEFTGDQPTPALGVFTKLLQLKISTLELVLTLA